jgi:hypothetical protein
MRTTDFSFGLILFERLVGQAAFRKRLEKDPMGFKILVTK